MKTIKLNNGNKCKHSVFINNKESPLLRTYLDVDGNPVIVVEQLGVEIAYSITSNVLDFIGYVGANSPNRRRFELHHILTNRYLKQFNGQTYTTQYFKKKVKNETKTSDKERRINNKRRGGKKIS